MDVVVRVFPVTSTSLSVVSRGLFGLLHGVLGSVCALSSSLFTRSFVNGRIVEPVSVSDAINFRLETVITPRCFCSEVVVCSACTLTTTSMLD